MNARDARLIRRILGGIIADHEMTRRYMDKMNRGMVDSASAIEAMGRGVDLAGEAISELNKALKGVK